MYQDSQIGRTIHPLLVVVYTISVTNLLCSQQKITLTSSRIFSYENIQRYDNLIDSSFDMIAITITGKCQYTVVVGCLSKTWRTVYRAGSVLTKFQTQTNQN